MDAGRDWVRGCVRAERPTAGHRQRRMPTMMRFALWMRDDTVKLTAVALQLLRYILLDFVSAARRALRARHFSRPALLARLFRGRSAADADVIYAIRPRTAPQLRTNIVYRFQQSLSNKYKLYRAAFSGAELVSPVFIRNIQLIARCGNLFERNASEYTRPIILHSIITIRGGNESARSHRSASFAPRSPRFLLIYAIVAQITPDFLIASPRCEVRLQLLPLRRSAHTCAATAFDFFMHSAVCVLAIFIAQSNRFDCFAASAGLPGPRQ